MAVVSNPIRMGRWSELMVVCVCHSDEVREADAPQWGSNPQPFEVQRATD